VPWLGIYGKFRGKEAGKADLDQSFDEFAVGGFEVAGVDAGGSGGGHEICIVGPAGNKVDMEVFGNPGPGGATQV